MPRAKFQIERTCQICGKPFMALTIESQYCSPACGRKAYKIRKREQKRNEELQQVVQDMDSDRDYIMVPEAIALYAVGRQTLYHYIRSGKIPSVNLGKRLTRLSKYQSLLAQADQIEVLEPASVRNEMRNFAKNLMSYYKEEEQ